MRESFFYQVFWQRFSNYFAVGMPGSTKFATAEGLGGLLALTVLGVIVGWGAGWAWSRRRGR